jgi:hypothetical protein
VHLRDGNGIEIGGNRAQVEAVLREVSERVPWAVTGYNVEVCRAWKYEQETFLSAVDKRREEILKTLAQEQAATEGEE